MSQSAPQVALRAVIWIVLPVVLGAVATTANGQTLASFSNAMGETVFYSGNDQHIHRVNCDRGSLCTESNFWLNTDLTVQLKIKSTWWLGPMTAFSNASGEHLLFVDYAENHINRLDCTDHCDLPIKWTNRNLRVQSSCSFPGLSFSTCSLFGYSDTETFGVDADLIYYEAADHTIHVLGGDSPTPAPVMPALGNLLSGFRTGSGWQSGEYLYYPDTNQHIHQLYGQWNQDQNGNTFLNWVDQDLTVTANPRVQVVGTGLASFSDASGPQVYFAVQVSPLSGQHVYRISTGSLVSQDLSQNTTAYGGAMSGLSDSSGEGVFYVGVDRHVHKLYCPSGSNCDQSSNWTNQDMTNLYGGALVGNLCPNNLTSFTDSYGESVFYVANDNTLHRLSTSSGDQTLVNANQSIPAAACPF